MSLGHGASIVRDGLVLHLDAANPKSYPGSGTTWFDLSGNSFNGNFVNGASHTLSNNGSVVLDGVDDYIFYDNSNDLSNVFNGDSNFTISVFFNVLSGSYLLDIGNTGGDPTGAMEFKVNRISRNNSSGGSSSMSLPLTSSWNHVVFTRDSSLVHKWYLNGVFSNSEQTTQSYNRNQTVKTGRRAFNNSGIYQGNISVITVYSKVLTPNEIQQNFEALRGRYGI